MRRKIPPLRPSQSQSAAALFAAIAQSGNDAARNWLRLASGASAPGAPADYLARLAADGARAGALQIEYVEKQRNLWQSLAAGMREAAVRAAPGDRRFAAKEWRDDPYYNYLQQSYLLAAEYMEQLVEASALEGQAKERLRFSVRQWVDAVSPANFAATNPEVLRLAQDTGGESLTRGLAQLIADARRGRIGQTDEAAFEVGRNLAVTPGSVVFENELIQLIQYKPLTRQGGQAAAADGAAVHQQVLHPRPAARELVRPLRGGAGPHGVHGVSWRNLGRRAGRHAGTTTSRRACSRRSRVVRDITGADRVNALGFCVGGTMLATALAVLAARGEDPVESATFLTTLLDFEDTGEIGMFVDEQASRAREATIGGGGLLPGQELATIFSSCARTTWSGTTWSATT